MRSEIAETDNFRPLFYLFGGPERTARSGVLRPGHFTKLLLKDLSGAIDRIPALDSSGI